jgi:site-specific DNA recombinase
MLLSFAQFEREVTSERIRDKVAASKKKGIWVGGTVPLGYQVIDRKLVVEPGEAKTVRMIFERYLALGTLRCLLAELNTKGIITRKRALATGRTIGGIAFTPGPLGYLLRNRTYIGELNHHDVSYPGEHEAIVDTALFAAVQARLSENLQNHHARRLKSAALLIGKLYDDAGNRMTPSSTRKRGLTHRYYVSRALLDGRKGECGSIPRAAADQVEALVVNALKEQLREGSTGDETSTATHVLLQSVERVVIQKTSLRIELADVPNIGEKVLEVPWAPKPGGPSREVLEAVGTTGDQRPMRSDVRASLLKAIALGRSWLQELTDGTVNDTNVIARREDRSKRSVHMTMSLAFLAPDIVEAAIGGQLPRRIGMTRLADLPPDWRKQRDMIGLRQPG